MIIVMAALLFIALDYFIFVQPISQAFLKTGPELASLKRARQILKEDKNNQDMIEKNWKIVTERLTAEEKRFVAPNGLPALLENLSKLAQDSGVKIISLKPVEGPSAAKATPFTRVPIELKAVAGTHELGRLLERLEGGPTFFRVTDMKITASQTESNKHSVELLFETYRRG